jgi:hypothetical protein
MIHTLSDLLCVPERESGHESGHRGPIVEAFGCGLRNRAMNRAIVARFMAKAGSCGRIGQGVELDSRCLEGDSWIGPESTSRIEGEK